MIYTARIQDENRQPHLRKVMIVGVRDEKDARRLLWEKKYQVVSFGTVQGGEVLIGDWEEPQEQPKEENTE